ncbi:hypothetical protein, partial [Mycobacteroides abscessus]|uniref:hypothetical protein n=1 Tax=Mycobacteroides abscessus TaxID=36809 RepID=UPI001A96B00A
ACLLDPGSPALAFPLQFHEVVQVVVSYPAIESCYARTVGVVPVVCDKARAHTAGLQQRELIAVHAVRLS